MQIIYIARIARIASFTENLYWCNCSPK